ncbi:MAG: response regulator transcription factor [Bacteroidales bacterium]|nr:response regulator transcription factor [Bacteroidales bacterium]
MDKIKVLIADDHKIFRDGIKALLEKVKDIEVVCEAENGDEVLLRLESNEVNVILMDIDMGTTNGFDTAVKVKKQFPDCNILVLSMHGDHNYIIKMLEAGAIGYILKNAGKEELLTAIRSVAGGDSYFSKEVSSRLIEQINRPQSSYKKKDKDVPLTEREIEILRLISQEYSNPEIAEELFISIRTVDTHRRNLLDKLGVKNTAGLVKYAIKKGIID